MDFRRVPSAPTMSLLYPPRLHRPTAGHQRQSSAQDEDELLQLFSADSFAVETPRDRDLSLLQVFLEQTLDRNAFASGSGHSHTTSPASRSVALPLPLGEAFSYPDPGHSARRVYADPHSRPNSRSRPVALQDGMRAPAASRERSWDSYGLDAYAEAMGNLKAGEMDGRRGRHNSFVGGMDMPTCGALAYDPPVDPFTFAGMMDAPASPAYPTSPLPHLTHSPTPSPTLYSGYPPFDRAAAPTFVGSAATFADPTLVQVPTSFDFGEARLPDEDVDSDMEMDMD